MADTADLEAALRAIGEPRWLGARGRVKAVTDSTMDDAWQELEDGADHGFVVVADHQRAGRGSHGRTWASPAGVDLYLSAVVRIPRPRPTMTLATALAVVDTVRGALGESGAEVRVKWPNDVLVDDRKIAGILCESRSRGARFDAVIGVGLNVNRASFDPKLEATSLHLASGHDVDRGEVLSRLLSAMERWLAAEPSAVTAALDDALAWRGERVSCDAIAGELLGVATDGGLRLRTDDGERVLHAGRLSRAT